MKIITKDIIGYEGLYQITNTGKVYRLPTTKTGNWGSSIFLPKREISITYSKNYPTVTLIKNGKQKTFLMHRLMAIHFIKNDNPLKREVNHKNKDISDYSLSNLEWCTRSENNKHARIKEGYGYKKEIDITNMRRKTLDFSTFCIHQLTVEAIKKKTDFKNYVQELAEREAIRLSKLNQKVKLNK